MTYEYTNNNNNGKERVAVKDGKYTICSNWGNGFGTPKQVTRSMMAACLRHTNAPAEIVSAVLAN